MRGYHPCVSGWRPDDEALLQRLEDESLVERLFTLIVGERGDKSVRLHRRAGGLVAEARKLPGAAEPFAAALAGDIVPLARFVGGTALQKCSPEMLHHLALFHGKAATALEKTAPELAANAWMWSLASWLALAEERQYLAKLEEAVLGNAAKSSAIPPERVPLELVTELGRRADQAARDLAPAGTAALVALARSADAAKIAAIPDGPARTLRIEASRRRNGAIESALNSIADALDEANVQGVLTTAGRMIILRAVSVWTWTGHDEAVEHFVVGQLDRIGWELYRARNWSELRYLMDPFRPMMENLAGRIEKDPSQLAYAAGCAQMYVFMAETEPNPVTKLILAERAVKICPTHRNGRVVLASILCDRASDAIRQMQIVRRTTEIERVEKMIERAEQLYPNTRELPEVKAKLEAVKTQVKLSW
jgi:hypothetical protein